MFCSAIPTQPLPRRKRSIIAPVMAVVTRYIARHSRQGFRDQQASLGVINSAIEEYTLSLHEGDLCIFYTDGITEARQGDEEFGYERLLQIARAARDRSAAAIKDEILDAVRTFIQSQLQRLKDLLPVLI